MLAGAGREPLGSSMENARWARDSAINEYSIVIQGYTVMATVPQQLSTSWSISRQPTSFRHSSVYVGLSGEGLGGMYDVPEAAFGSSSGILDNPAPLTEKLRAWTAESRRE